jgi:predicted dehydrogenase
MAAEIGVAVVGLGGKGRSHARNLASLPGVRLLALCDVDEGAIARARDELGAAGAAARGTSDVESVLADPHVAAVVIATQHDSHRPLAVAAARARKHLLIEKPLALTAPDCRAIVEAVEANGVQAVMGFQARHRHFVRLMRERLPSPKVVVGEIIDPKWPDEFWAVDPIKGGGNVLSQGVHTFDLVCYLAGGEPKEIHARGGVFSHDPSRTPTVDTCLGTIAFDNGALGSVTIGDFGPLPWLADKCFYQLFDARDRSATMYGDRLLFASLDADGRRTVEELTEADPVDGPRPDYQGTVRLVEELVDCARENRPPRIGATAREG